jgi:hypothetical protein
LRLVTAVLLVVPFATFAACLEHTPPAASPATPNTEAEPTMVVPPPAAPKLNETVAFPELAGVRLESCAGVSLRLDVPEERVRDRLPPGLEAYSSLGLAQVNVFVQRCPRVVLPGGVPHDVALLWTAARVEPVNRSWVAGGFSLYALDVFVASNDTANDLKERGLPARSASFEAADTVLPGGGTRHVWTFTAGGDQIRVAFQVPVHSEDTPEEAADYHVWSGNRTLARLDVREKLRYHVPFVSADGATLEVAGDGALRALVGLDRFVAAASPLWDWTWDVPRPPLTFAASEPESTLRGTQP